MDYAILNRAQKVKIPVIEAYIKITTADEKNLNNYNRFILKFLKDNKDVSYMQEILKFKKSQIEDELKALQKYKLVEFVDEKYILSELGLSLISKIEEVEIFNKRKEKVLIDKYSEAILNYRNDLKIVKGNNYKISKDKYMNINPVNSKDYFEKKYLDEFKFINIDDIDIEVELGKEYWIELDISTIKYFIDINGIKGYLNNISNLFSIEDKELINYCEHNRLRDIQCVGTIYKINVIPYDIELDKYRDIIENLNIIEKFNKDLLSNKGIEIINRKKNEEKMKEFLSSSIYLDSVTGAFTDLYEEEEIKKRGNSIHLDSNVNLSQDDIEYIVNLLYTDEIKKLKNQNCTYYFKYSLEKLEVIKNIPFNIFYGGNRLC